MGAALLTAPGPSRATTPAARLRGRRRWSELSRVERVGLYTRQSLYLVLAGFNALVLLGAAAGLDDGTQSAVLLGGGLLVTATALAVFVPLVVRFPLTPELSWRQLAPLLAVCAVVVVVAETSLPDAARAAAVTTVAASMAIVLGALPDNRVAVAVVVGSGLLLGITAGEPGGFVAGVIAGLAFIFTVRASLWLFGIVTDLDDAGHVKAQLAVMEERLRFSRDVHDVLGRRLSTIAVQAELASTLAARGDARAAERMLEVRGVAHDALREARELARGYRPTDFLNELDGARSLLRSAGIEVHSSVDDMPRAWHEAAGWVVRESVTNVLRHSSARVVEIGYAEGELRVANDGARTDGTGDGSGLAGLRERLAPLGASLVARPEGDGRWVVVARFAGTGPLSAADTELPPS